MCPVGTALLRRRVERLLEWPVEVDGCILTAEIARVFDLQ